MCCKIYKIELTIFNKIKNNNNIFSPLLEKKCCYAYYQFHVNNINL